MLNMETARTRKRKRSVTPPIEHNKSRKIQRIVRTPLSIDKTTQPTNQSTYETPNVVSSGIPQFTYETPNVVSSGIPQSTYETPNVVSSGIPQSTYETPNVVSSGIPQFTDLLLSELPKVFKELSFEVVRNLLDDSSVRYDHIHGLACKKKDTCECFALKVYHLPDSYVLVDRIRYKYADECKLTGTDILVRLTKTFRTHHIQPVQLYDVAKIHITVDGKPEQLKLSTYSILLHGISWYNKYGYLSDTHENEVEHNNKVANSSITPKLLKEVNKVFDGSYTVLPKTTFREFTQSVNEVRLDNSIPEEQKNKFIRAYLLIEEYLTKNRKIKYNYYNLKLQEHY